MQTPYSENILSEILGKLQGVSGPDAKGNYKALCPFHDDKKASLSLHPKKGWKCFAGCGKGTIVKLTEDLGIASGGGKKHPEAIYQYHDADGRLLFEVLRYSGRKFSQRRPDQQGGWIWDRKSVRPVVYRLPELLAAPDDATLFVVEGEKDVEAVRSLGLTATCNPGGAGKFTADLKTPFQHRHIVIIADKDAPGRRHAQQVGQLLHGFAATVRVLELPGEKVKDAADWVAAGGTREELKKLAEESPQWTPCVPGDQAEVSRGGLPQVIVSGCHLREIVQGTWDVLHSANDPAFVFQRGHLLVDIIRDDNGQPVLRTLDKPAFKGILDRVADFVKEDEDGFTPARPPGDVIADMMAAKELPLPVLLGIIEAPAFAPPGVLATAPGYQSETRLYLHVAKGISIPYVPEQPDGASVSQARSLLLDDLLVDFPFVSEADRTHAVAALLLPFVRPLIDGPTPMHLVESPTPGSGKGLLADVLTIPAAGRGSAVMTEGCDEDEWRKRITAKLLQAPQFILLDNIRSRLDSAALSAALTSDTWEDRILGHSRTAALPVTCVWLATATNPALSLEIARRTVPIRLDASVERPWERTGFKHPNLRHWAKQHRSQLIWAALTLVQAWIGARKPTGGETLGSYEGWSEVLGGILVVAGIPGFLGSLDRVYAEADRETRAWAEFCESWWEEFQDRPVGTDLLFGLATRYRLLLDVWGGRADHSGRTRFGIALAKMRDRVIGDVRIYQAGPDAHSKVQQYELLHLRGVRGVAGGSAPCIFSPATSNAHGTQHAGVRQEEVDDQADIKLEGQEAPQPPASPRDESRGWWEVEL